MPWLAVNEDMTERIFISKPIRGDGVWEPLSGREDDMLETIDGMIEYILGRRIFWEDEPVEME